MAEQFYRWDSKSLIETQFSLATSKPNSHWQQSKPNFYWQHQIPIFINTTLSKKKRAQDYQSLAKEKKYIMLPKQERLIASIHEETQKNVSTNKSP